MKKILLPLLFLIGGSGVGAAAAYGTGQFLAPATERTDQDEPTSFVPSGKIVAPLVLPGGRLSGYVAFDVQLEVRADKAEFVAARMPLLLHAINMRTYRTPLAAGPDGMLPDLAAFRTLVMNSAKEAFGGDVVRLAAITQAVPE